MSNPAFEFDHLHLISEDPRSAASWYVETLGASLVADTTARGAPQIFLELGGRTLIVRGKRPGEAPTRPKPVQPFSDFSSHDQWGIDHFGFLYHGDLRAFSAQLRARDVAFPVELKEGVGGNLLCYISAPDGVSIELMQAPDGAQ